jgi:hypothetical protein
MVIVAERLAAVFCLARSPTAPPKRFQTTVLRSIQQLSAPHLNLGSSELPLGGVSSRASGDKAAYSGIRAVQERAGQRPALCARVGVVLRVLDNHRFLSRLTCADQRSKFQTPDRALREKLGRIAGGGRETGVEPSPLRQR